MTDGRGSDGSYTFGDDRQAGSFLGFLEASGNAWNTLFEFKYMCRLSISSFSQQRRTSQFCCYLPLTNSHPRHPIPPGCSLPWDCNASWSLLWPRGRQFCLLESLVGLGPAMPDGLIHWSWESRVRNHQVEEPLGWGQELGICKKLDVFQRNNRIIPKRWTYSVFSRCTWYSWPSEKCICERFRDRHWLWGGSRTDHKRVPTPWGEVYTNSGNGRRMRYSWWGWILGGWRSAVVC